MFNDSLASKKSKKILFIVGTMNTTTMLHQIAEHLTKYDIYFAPMYADGFLDLLARKGLTDFVPLAGKVKSNTEDYLRKHRLKIDHYGSSNDYDLVVTCTDLIMPKNILDKKIVHVQEGMTDPEDIRYWMVKTFKLPRYIASTSTMGLSDQYDIFCVASEGYKELFIRKGVNPDKIRVTGLPNFDNFEKYKRNDFPHRNFVLVATSDARETMKYENRKKFIEQAIEIAQGKQLIFKLHPNENHERAVKEINRWAPGSIIYTDGNIHEMIANSDVLITKYSTTVYTGIALGKEVYSEVEIDTLRRLSPIQNAGGSGKKIAEYCEQLIETGKAVPKYNNFKWMPFADLTKKSKELLNKVNIKS